LKHLLYLKDLDQETISQILDIAENFLNHNNKPIGYENVLENRTLANLFFEPSTRTRSTFEIASKNNAHGIAGISMFSQSS